MEEERELGEEGVIVDTVKYIVAGATNGKMVVEGGGLVVVVCQMNTTFK